MARRPAKSVLHRCFALVAAAWALLCTQLNRERDSWFAWMVVAFGAGIALYYSLKAEPAFWLVPTSALLCAALLPLLRRLQGARFALAAITAAVLAGFCLAAFKSHILATRTLPVALENVTIEGVVLSRNLIRDYSASSTDDDSENDSDTDADAEDEAEPPPPRFRYVIAPLVISGIAQDALPQKLRLTPSRFAYNSPPLLNPGDFVHMQASLFPPSGPVAPGAYAPSRRMWFAGIGAVGWFQNPVVLNAPSHSLPWRQRAGIRMEKLRLDILARIRQHSSGNTAGLAATLIVDERGLLPAASLQALRHSGLAHILAISGLHMAMIAGGVFLFISRGLVLIPSLVHKFPLHKWAAVAAMGAATFYLTLSGGSIAPTRAFIMAMIVLFSILCDRPAISTRNVALAALAVLVLWPESLMDAGFQLSFAATLALVAVYENRFPSPFLRGAPPWMLALRTVKIFILTLVVTSAVAGFATALLLIHHFQYLPILGVLTNVLAMPVFTFHVMPLMLVSLSFMPFGWEKYPLQAVYWGSEFLIRIAALVGGYEKAVLHTDVNFPWLPPVFALALCWLCLWRGFWRFLGLLALGVVVVLMLLLGGESRPLLLVNDRASVVGMLGADGARHNALYSKRTWLDGWETKIWSQRDDKTEATASARPWHCAAGVCTAVLPDKRGNVVYVREAQPLARLCAEKPMILISPLRVDDDCAHLVIDGNDVRRHGAHAIHLRSDGLEVISAADAIGARPWSPYIPAAGR